MKKFFINLSIISIIVIIGISAVAMNAQEQKYVNEGIVYVKIEANKDQSLIDAAALSLSNKLNELEKAQKCVISIIPYENSSPQAQFSYTRTEGFYIRYVSSCENNSGKLDIKIVELKNKGSIDEIKKILEKTINNTTIIVPLVDQCGVLQINPYGCTVGFLILY